MYHFVPAKITFCSRKSNILLLRKVTFCSRESIILFHAKFSRRMNFMLRITFSMENSSRGHAKTILKNVSFCSRESNILLPRKVTFCSRKSIILFYAKSLDLVTKNLFTKYKYIEIVHQKLWKKNYGFGYIKFFSPLLVTKNFFTKYGYNEFVHCTAPSLGLKKKTFFWSKCLRRKIHNGPCTVRERVLYIVDSIWRVESSLHEAWTNDVFQFHQQMA